MEYVVKIEPRYEDFYAWNRTYRDKVMKPFTSATKSLLILCAFVIVCLAVIFIKLRTFQPSFAVILVLYALFCAYFFSAYKLYSKWGMSWYKKIGFTEARFTDGGIVCKYKNREKELDYSDVRALFATDGCFYVMPRRSLCLILPKSGFAQGDFDGFRTFMERKTELQMIEINVDIQGETR